MFSQRLKKLRISHGLNQVELGKKLSVSKQTVSNWENSNIQPSVDMLVSIAKYFNVSTDYLLGLENQKIIYADGLTDTQIAHINMIIADIKNNKE